MRDSRLMKRAELLVHYSLDVKPGQNVLIQGDVAALPLIEACYEVCLAAKGLTEYLLVDDQMHERLLHCGTDSQLQNAWILKRHAIQEFDALLFIYAPTNLQSAATLSHSRQR